MYEVVLDVPADAAGISFGALLNGRGEIWLNGVKFDVVGRTSTRRGRTATVFCQRLP